MTVIAWDGRSVAADRLGVVSGGGRSFHSHSKLEKRDDKVYATTGMMAPMRDAWIAWHESGCDPASVPPCGALAEDLGNFIVFHEGKCFIFSAMVPYPCEEAAPFAWGSGGDYALGAMLAGADAKVAAEIAIACDTRCGGPVDVIEMLQPSPFRTGRFAEIRHLPNNAA